jgi:hypothetical protein
MPALIFYLSASEIDYLALTCTRANFNFLSNLDAQIW